MNTSMPSTISVHLFLKLLICLVGIAAISGTVLLNRQHRTNLEYDIKIHLDRTLELEAQQQHLEAYLAQILDPAVVQQHALDTFPYQDWDWQDEPPGAANATP